MEIYIKNIYIGFTFRTPYPKDLGELFEVTDIKLNKDYGTPCYDYWGGIVWEKPMYEVEYRNIKGGKTRRFVVQSENSLLNWIIIPCS